MTKLIVGLGNPGQKYVNTPHNVGFRVVDLWLRAGNPGLSPKGKFKSELFSVKEPGLEVIVLKPQTFMNLSGQAVQECSGFYKIPPADILVISDDLNLPMGQIRFRENGGHGGHNGLRDIIRLIGQDFKRLRIGISRPEEKDRVSDYVLSRPDGEAEKLLQAAEEKAAGLIDQFNQSGIINVPPQ